MFLFFYLVILIIGIIIFVIFKAKQTKSQTSKLSIALSSEDLLSQAFFLLAMGFFGLSLLALNRDFGSPIAGQTILLITSIIGLAIAYYFKIIYVLIASLIGVYGWWGYQGAKWAEVKDINTIFVVSGIILLSLILYILHKIHKKYFHYERAAIVYKMLGLLPATIILFIFSTNFGLKFFETLTQGVNSFASLQISIILVLLFLILVGLLAYSANSKFLFNSELGVIIFILVLFLIIPFLPEQTIFTNYAYRTFSSIYSFTTAGVFWVVLFNVAIFLKLLGIIFLGYLEKEDNLINIGVFLLFILIIVKYFDWFFDFFDKSFFFIGAGFLLFIVGYFMEKTRKRLIAEIEEGPEN